MSSHKLSPFPYPALIALCSALITHCYSMTSLFPYVGYMTLSFGKTEDKDEAGFYAGYVAGAFMAGRFLSSYYWGYWSDIYGRKPTLYIGICSTFIFSMLFGMSKSLWFAISCRFFLGLFNGIISTCKVAVSEICGKEHEVKGMTVITGCWSLSYVFGPAVGGLLANPCTQYPSIFGNITLFQTFPYLLPNLVACFISAVTLIAVTLYLPETVIGCKKIDIFVAISKNRENKTQQSKLTMTTNASIKEQVEEEKYNGNGNNNVSLCTEQSSLLKNKDGKFNGIPENTQYSEASKEDDDIEFRSIVENSPECYDGSEPRAEASSMCNNLMRILAIPTARNILLNYMLLSFLVIMFDECFPLWALSTVEKGGLDWTAGTIGQILSAVGIIMSIFQFLIYPHVAHKLGYVRMQKVVSILAIPLYFSFPYTSILRDFPISSSLVVVLNMACAKILSNMLFTSVALITNNSVPTELRGSLNGVSMTVGSLSKALGPPTGSLLFAYSISDQSMIPLVDYHLVFNICALLSVLFALESWWCFSDEIRPSKTNNELPK